MDSSRKLLKILILVLCFGAVFYAFSWKVGSGHYYHNDGVTMSCALEPVPELLHPGSMSAKGCTFDHQPLYLLLVKGISSLFGFELKIYQYLNALFFGLAWLIMCLGLSKKNNFLLSVAVPFFFLSSFSLLHRVQELRMYALYLATCCGLIVYFEEMKTNAKEKWSAIILFLVGYFNFIMFLLPFTAYSLAKFIRWKFSDKRFNYFIGVLTILVLIKIPYVLWWRVKLRSGGVLPPFSLVWSLFYQNIFVGVTAYAITAWVLAVVSILWMLFFSKRALEDLLYVSLILISVLMVFICTLILNMHELELRYFLFFTPIFTVLTAKFLNQVLPEKIKNVLAVMLFALAFYNCTQMTVVGPPDGGEIKLSAEAFTLANRPGREIWTDDEYFFFNYVGIYSYVESGKDSRPKAIAPGVVLNKTSQERIFVSVHSSPEQHAETLKQFPGRPEQLWSMRNFLGQSTIITLIHPDN
jgi:hypothetical protein